MGNPTREQALTGSVIAEPQKHYIRSAQTQAKFASRASLFVLFSIHWSSAQLGSGWVQYAPDKKIHLAQEESLNTFDWAAYKEICSPPCASYTYDAATGTETFKLYEARSNRSEIRLFNDYEFGARQFEGYVTFYAPLNDESLMQVWGSETGATQMMIRGFAANGGEIGINNGPISGTPRVATNCYGREIKVNVIHLQEDVGNKFIVYLDNKKTLEFSDNEKPTNNNNMNYHKYGCYGTVFPGYEGPVVKWRNVRHFRDGKAPDATTGNALSSFRIPEVAPTSLVLYSINGRRVWRLIDSYPASSTFGKNPNPRLSSGVYVRESVLDVSVPVVVKKW